MDLLQIARAKETTKKEVITTSYCLSQAMMYGKICFLIFIHVIDSHILIGQSDLSHAWMYLTLKKCKN